MKHPNVQYERFSYVYMYTRQWNTLHIGSVRDVDDVIAATERWMRCVCFGAGKREHRVNTK